MKMALAEVYEVATFYAHFDVVKEGDTPPPAITVRVCDSLSCAMAGAEKLLTELTGAGRARMSVSFARAMAWALATSRRFALSVMCRHSRRSVDSVAKAVDAHEHAQRGEAGEVARNLQSESGGYALLKSCLASADARGDDQGR